MRRLLRSWRGRVAVDGHSMEPTLRAGDWLLVDTDAYALHPPRVGEIVVVEDPRQPGRWLVKRVAALNEDRTVQLVGDHVAHGREELLARVATAALLGRPWFRYWPPARIGRLR